MQPEKQIKDPQFIFMLPSHSYTLQVYNDITEVLNSDSEGRITVLHFPNYDDMDAEVVCAALEEFQSISSAVPKILVIDNQDVLSHPCNSK